ncbi:MAG: 16S rRNA (adenine(1518)-N(6)/adenine(1519)-N(6))-dimethyltransferase RsmA [Candidatus Peribacteraceae bacterium]|jgi:16S rRNA (adenine1518-N6/adenine1519-N6)-dimethyltransferase|nr:16S rRNA (adenine(1518)-N(6)/adenine(1519)-N(6))-dimethyltransferase RsmA [Candidatus Peribacteraceae bacterium]
MQSVKDFCRHHGLKLNTDLGQHFLIDESVLEKIVEAGDIQMTDHIVEIGPGIGVLTKQLLEKAAKVTAIELDKKLIPYLHLYTGGDTKLNVINDNALNVSLPDDPYKIVANIPYHITSPLLRHAMMESSVTPKSLTLLIQKEVADRICDTNNASILTIVVGLFGKAKKICDVPPKAFLPPPKVDSAVLHIDCYDKPLASVDAIEEVMKLTKIGFSQKRKMLRNTFSTFPGGLELLLAADIDETRRPQTLSIDEWIALAKKSNQN